MLRSMSLYSLDVAEVARCVNLALGYWTAL